MRIAKDAAPINEYITQSGIPNSLFSLFLTKNHGTEVTKKAIGSNK